MDCQADLCTGWGPPEKKEYLSGYRMDGNDEITQLKPPVLLLEMSYRRIMFPEKPYHAVTDRCKIIF